MLSHYVDFGTDVAAFVVSVAIFNPPPKREITDQRLGDPLIRQESLCLQFTLLLPLNGRIL